MTESAHLDSWRTEARAWLRANVPTPPLESLDTAAGFVRHQEWEAKLHEQRLAVITWPEEYGGRGMSVEEWLVFEEEYWAANAPARVSQNGIFLLAPTIFEYGTEEQKQRYLPSMASGEKVWAQGWSEPGAGSDLANLRSKARKVDGGWRVSGQKTWSSRAVFAHWIFGLFRTDPDSTRHHGLTYLLMPLDAPGITVRPIRQFDGEAGFAEVFFDEVFVPDEDVLGEVGQGWAVAMSTTTSERGLTLRSPGRFMAAADRLVELFKTQGDASDTATADGVTQCWLDSRAYKHFVDATAARMRAGQPIGFDSSANKVFWSQLDIRIHELALQILGDEAYLTEGEHAAWLDGYQFALAGPIYGGTNEIQRNIVAERILGLPR